MTTRWYADGSTALDTVADTSDDPTLNNVGSVGQFERVMREHGIATLSLSCWYDTGKREQHFVGIANISMDTLKEVCANWLRAKYGDISIAWYQNREEIQRSDGVMIYFHAKFTTRPQSVTE